MSCAASIDARTLRVADKGDVALIVGDLENHLHRKHDGRGQIDSFQITQKRDHL